MPPGTDVLCAILSWQSCGVSRVTHASFDFEAISAVSSLDMLMNVRKIVGEAIVSICPSIKIEHGEARKRWKENVPGVELHTDSMGLVKAVRRGVSQSLSSRRRRDILDLRDKMYHDGLVVMHIDGPTNSVDVGTKNDRTEKALVVLTRKIVQGLYHPCGSKNFEKTSNVNKNHSSWAQCCSPTWCCLLS